MCSLNDDNEGYRYDGSAWVLFSGTSASATATVSSLQSTTSESFTDLATVGPAVTITTGTKALVIVNGYIYNTTDRRRAVIGFAVSGATTIAATDTVAYSMFSEGINDPQIQSSNSYLITGLTAGSNTFTCKYQTGEGAGTTSYKRRNIIVIDMGS